MIKCIFIILALIYSAQAVAWNEGIRGELRWGETMFLENYSLKLADFSIEDSHSFKVLVELQADNLTIARRALQAGEWFDLNDSIKVTAEQIVKGDIEDDPFAIIRLQLPAAADISLILKGDRETYQGGDEMRVQLQIENRGIVDAENLRIIVDSTPPFVNERYSISIVEAGRVWDKKKETHDIDNFKINIKAPYFPHPTDLRIEAHALYSDPQGKAYESWGGAAFHIRGPIQLHKRVEETQEFQESYYVINSLRNSGNRTLDLELSDSTGSGFRADCPLSWKFTLTPGEAKTISYLIEAQQPGLGQMLPNAEVGYLWGENRYIVRSEKPVVDIFGPSIEAERKVSPTKLHPGDVAAVSIQLTNTGNKQAAITLQESVPNGTELVSGSVNQSVILPPNGTYSNDYQLRCMEKGTVIIPCQELNYRDARGNEYHTSMKALEIDVQEKKTDNRMKRNSTDAALNGTGRMDSQNMTGQASVQTEKADVQKENAGEKTGDANEGIKDGGDDYLPALLITIIVLMSAAISRYL
ncbi:MAG: hypothetical protein A4E49_02159 [Methanosaeta sp. PtaU1.Bin112]|nr:MAG: hypothetical protein A4E49_02159 [Methanosaeta sp. PtaU1.Bin112]